MKMTLRSAKELLKKANRVRKDEGYGSLLVKSVERIISATDKDMSEVRWQCATDQRQIEIGGENWRHYVKRTKAGNQNVEEWKTLKRLSKEKDELTLKIEDPINTLSFELHDIEDYSKYSICHEPKGSDSRIFDEEISITKPSSGDNVWSFRNVNQSPVRIDIDDDTRTKHLTFHGTRPDNLEGSDKKRAKVALPRSEGKPSHLPILLITVDSFRYDYLDAFDEFIQSLGSGAVVPQEPRTQAGSTPPSHASIFTGTYPSVHGYFGKCGRTSRLPLSNSLTLLPEILLQNRYTCRASVNSGLPYKNGFGRYFHQYLQKDMSWTTREHDAGEIVNDAIQWLENDITDSDSSVFYFLHLFDPHFPYLPPDPTSVIPHTDFTEINRYREKVLEQNEDYYETVYGPPPDTDALNIEDLKQYYRKSLEYTASQLTRLIEKMKSSGVFSESCIIVTGDHGEEFFERKFGTHTTCYDANIRPGFVIKPPSNADMAVPDAVDHIDILPTIASMVGKSVPAQCNGVPLQRKDRTQRISERVKDDYHVISVEQDGNKGIFTFNADFPECPTPKQIRDGPVHTEYYDLDEVREEIYYNRADAVESTVIDELEETAKEHLRSMERIDQPTQDREIEISGKREERLRMLGYK